MFVVACRWRLVLDCPVKRSIFVITGTDTGVGKTVLTCLLAGHLRDSGVSVAALKPVCSGDRGDAHPSAAVAQYLLLCRSELDHDSPRSSVMGASEDSSRCRRRSRRLKVCNKGPPSSYPCSLKVLMPR